MQKKQIIIATGNQDKFFEIINFLKEYDISCDFFCLKDFPNLRGVIEDKNTIEENSYKKAFEIFLQTGIPSLADDTGLFVDFLNGEPGVFSAKYAGINASYNDNINKILQKLEGIKNRNAYFKTVITFVENEGKFFQREGICKGTILEKKVGIQGFGYDPIFYENLLQKTFSEMSVLEKNRVSHRGKALKNIKIILEEYLKK